MAKKITNQKTFKISILERIKILANMKTGDMITIVIVRDLHKKIGLLQEEIKKYKISTDENGNLKSMTYEGTVQLKGFSFTDLEEDQIKLSLSVYRDKLSEAKKLTLDDLSLLEKFGVNVG